MRPVLVALLVTVLAAGCGGGGAGQPKDPKAALEQVLDNYDAALAHGDWDKACRQMAPEFVLISRQQLEQKVGAVPNQCPKVWEISVAKGVTDRHRLEDATADARFDGADVTGNTARIDFSEYVDGDRIAMTGYARRDDDGNWKLTNISGP